MIRNCAVIALFMSKMIVAAFSLGSSEDEIGARLAPIPDVVVVHQPAELPPTIISGLPEDAGTLRR